MATLQRLQECSCKEYFLHQTRTESNIGKMPKAWRAIDRLSAGHMLDMPGIKFIMKYVNNFLPIVILNAFCLNDFGQLIFIPFSDRIKLKTQRPKQKGIANFIQYVKLHVAKRTAILFYVNSRPTSRKDK